MAWPLILTARRAGADPVGDSFAELEQRTREYQDSLGRLASVLEEALARATAAADRSRRLHAEGLIARGDVEEAARAVTEAERRLGETRRQLTDSETVMAEARALRQLAALPPVPPGAELSTPEVRRVPRRQRVDPGPGRESRALLLRALRARAPRDRSRPDAAPRAARVRSPERRRRRGPPRQQRGPGAPRLSPLTRHPVPRLPRAGRGRVDRRPRARRRPLSPNGLSEARHSAPSGRSPRRTRWRSLLARAVPGMLQAHGGWR